MKTNVTISSKCLSYDCNHGEGNFGFQIELDRAYLHAFVIK